MNYILVCLPCLISFSALHCINFLVYWAVSHLPSSFLSSQDFWSDEAPTAPDTTPASIEWIHIVQSTSENTYKVPNHTEIEHWLDTEFTSGGYWRRSCNRLWWHIRVLCLFHMCWRNHLSNPIKGVVQCWTPTHWDLLSTIHIIVVLHKTTNKLHIIHFPTLTVTPLLQVIKFNVQQLKVMHLCKFELGMNGGEATLLAD